MFCKTCGSLLQLKKTEYGRWNACPHGHTQPSLNQERTTLTIQNKQQAQHIEIVEDKNLLAVHDHLCPKCSYDKAELIEISASYSDEDNTYRMKCGKCKYVVKLEGKTK